MWAEKLSDFSSPTEAKRTPSFVRTYLASLRFISRLLSLRSCKELAEEGSAVGVEQCRAALKADTWESKLFQGGNFLKEFRGMMRENPSILEARDPAGASPLHIMLLYNTDLHIQLACEVILQYPDRCEDQYLGGVFGENGQEIPDRYTGENALHLAIVNGNRELAQLLCATRPTVLTHHATGRFFAPGGHCYYGELPLSFAVCTNQPEMVRMLLEMGADLNAVDKANGNTALHMAVVHGLKDMFDLLREEWAARKPAHPEWWDAKPCLSDRRNAHGQTCLTLAAAEGTVDMFDHVLSCKGRLMWAYGAVTCQLYPVESLEIGTPNAMTYMLQQGRHELLSLPRIRRLHQTKWDVFGKQRLNRRLWKHCFVLVVLQLGLLLPRDANGSEDLLALMDDWWVLLRPVCECIVVCAALHKLCIELKELYSTGLSKYFRFVCVCVCVCETQCHRLRAKAPHCQKDITCSTVAPTVS